MILSFVWTSNTIRKAVHLLSDVWFPFVVSKSWSNCILVLMKKKYDYQICKDQQFFLFLQDSIKMRKNKQHLCLNLTQIHLQLNKAWIVLFPVDTVPVAVLLVTHTNTHLFSLSFPLCSLNETWFKLCILWLFGRTNFSVGLSQWCFLSPPSLSVSHCSVS